MVYVKYIKKKIKHLNYFPLNHCHSLYSVSFSSFCNFAGFVITVLQFYVVLLGARTCFSYGILVIVIFNSKNHGVFAYKSCNLLFYLPFLLLKTMFSFSSWFSVLFNFMFYINLQKNYTQNLICLNTLLAHDVFII